MIKDTNHYSSLKARLEFKPYVPPVDASSVKERLELPDHYKKSNLSRYLELKGINIEEGKYMLRRNQARYFYLESPSAKRINLHITTNPRKMTLDLKATSEGEITITDHLNLIELDNFILTGRWPGDDDGFPYT